MHSKSNHTTSTLRALLLRYPDDELTALLFDNYREVHQKCTTCMTKGEKVQMLLEHCEHRFCTDKLAQLVDPPPPESPPDDDFEIIHELFIARSRLQLILDLSEKLGGIYFLPAPLRQEVQELHDDILELKLLLLNLK